MGFKDARGYSQARLGIDAGIEEASASTRMNQYEQGAQLPDLEMAARRAEVLDVSMANLFCPEDYIAEPLLVVHSLGAKKRKEVIGFAEGIER